jgi:hypothetical protein
MKRAVARVVVLLASLSALSLNVAWGQNSGGVASISGVIQDSTGAVVPGATVLVENMSKGIRRELTTNGAGVFNAPALVPAEGYSVTVTKPGFATYQLKDIELQVGQQLSITPALSVSGAATQIQVVAETPVIEGTKTDVSGVVDARMIADLPINGRRVDSFVLTQPGVTNDAGFGLLSFRGTAGGNSFLTDGVDTTNQFYDENAGRSRTYNISQDSVQEFQVVSSNFAAEYGHASGGVINTVTRSGSNSLHGTAYWFFRNRTLSATDVFANGINPPEWRHQAGLSVGGPVKKDKLFYFFNGELQRRNFPIISSNGFSTYFTQNGTYIPGSASNPNCGAPASAGQCQAAIAYLSTRVVPQLVPRVSDVNLLFGKIDYNINDRNRLSLEENYLDFRSPFGIQTAAVITGGGGVGNNGDSTVSDRTEKAGLTTVVTPNMVNELKLGIFKDRQFDAANPALLPSVGLIGLTVGNLSNAAYAPNYPRTLPSELRIQVLESLSYTRGKHSMKFGFDFDHVEDYVATLANQYGTYTYSTLTQFAEDFSNPTQGKNWTTYSQRFGNKYWDQSVKQISLYAQDEYHLTPKLTITPGVRYEWNSIPQPTQVNAAWPQTGQIPGAPLQLAPRIGIAYAMNEKTVIRAGFGMFYNRYITSTFESLFFNNGLYQPSYSLRSNTAAQLAAGPVFPNYLAAAPANVPGSASISFADPGFRNSYTEQLSFAVERQLARNTRLTASYIWSRGLHVITGQDINAAPPTTSYTYPVLDASGATVSRYTTGLYTQRVNPAYGTVMDISAGANSYYNGLVVQLTKRYSGWFEAQANYTWAHAIDYNVGGAAGATGNSGILYTPSFPNSYANGDWRSEKGSSSNDQRHRLALSGVFSPRFVKGNSLVDRYLINNWQLAAISTFASSFPLVPTISNVAFPPGVALLSTSSINGLGGSTRVPFESISTLDVAPIYRTDARITKTLKFHERFQAQLMFEAVNVFNHVILTARNQQQFATKLVNGTVALAPLANYSLPSGASTPPDGTTARRAQAAIRLVF